MTDNKLNDQRITESLDNSTSPSGEHHSEERRRVLKKILAGGGIAAGAAMLPERWTRPVVDVIVAPAHAQGSPMAPAPSTGNGTARP